MLERKHYTVVLDKDGNRWGPFETLAEVSAFASKRWPVTHEDIAYFQRERSPDRFYPSTDPTKPGRPKPLHPIVIEGIGPIPLGKGYE
jgi:hypothetical protein